MLKAGVKLMNDFKRTTHLKLDIRFEPKNNCPHILVRKGYYLGLEIDKYFCVRCGAVSEPPGPEADRLPER